MIPQCAWSNGFSRYLGKMQQAAAPSGYAVEVPRCLPAILPRSGNETTVMPAGSAVLLLRVSSAWAGGDRKGTDISFKAKSSGLLISVHLGI
jgi:hypothetical protein